MKRLITRKEEAVIRLCHHDHGGMGVEDAAIYMDCTVNAVNKYLRNAKKKAPQLFPILTPQHRAILTLYDEHLSCEFIAKELGISDDKLEREVTFLRKHGHLFNHTMESYEPSMDSQIKHKF